YEAEVIGVEDFATDSPRLRFRHQGREQELECDFIAGCDGYHGICRQSVPQTALHTYERTYPFGWLGMLTKTQPISPELDYSNHAHGFALASMRSNSVSRSYIQCSAEEKVENWSDDRFWAEFRLRIGERESDHLETGPSIEKSIALARSFVA